MTALGCAATKCVASVVDRRIEIVQPRCYFGNSCDRDVFSETCHGPALQPTYFCLVLCKSSQPSNIYVQDSMVHGSQTQLESLVPRSQRPALRLALTPSTTTKCE
jgi:hypothetical protein